MVNFVNILNYSQLILRLISESVSEIRATPSCLPKSSVGDILSGSFKEEGGETDSRTLPACSLPPRTIHLLMEPLSSVFAHGHLELRPSLRLRGARNIDIRAKHSD